MSNGKKKEQSPTRNKKVKRQPPKWLLDEYEKMKALAKEWEGKNPPQYDTCWHSAWKRTGAALRDEYGMEDK